jgi:ubiquinone biosynthesis protein
MRFVRPVVKTVGNISGTVRDVGRLREVAIILVRHGMGMLVAGIDVPGISKSSEFTTTPERTVAAIQELGPTFIKLGQILSTRPDVMSDDYINALQSLQDDVKPLEFKEIENILSAEFGIEWRNLFLSVNEESLATASIAQVHRAMLHDGKEVVLKVQRSGIESLIHSDLNIIKLLLDRFIHEFPEMELFDPYGMFNEFRKSLAAELDFEQELRNLHRFRKNFFHDSIVRLPEPYEEYSTKKVVCMEYFGGVKIRSAREHGCDMTLIGERYLKVAYSMLFEHGFFHGDLHPGNVMVLEDNVIGVIDCGMVGRLTTEMKDQLAALIFALYRGENRMIAKIFYDISIKEKRVDYLAFERDAIEVAEQHWSGGSFSEMDIGAFLLDLTRGALRHHVHAPTSFTMFFKGVLTTEGLAKSLLPEVDPLKAAQPYVERLIKERWTPHKWGDFGVQNVEAFASIVKRLPISMSQLLDDFDHQRLYLKVEKIERKQDQDSAMRRQGILVIAIMSVGWMALGIAGLFLREFYAYGIPLLTIISVFIAMVMQLIVVVRVWFK